MIESYHLFIVTRQELTGCDTSVVLRLGSATSGMVWKLFTGTDFFQELPIPLYDQQ